MNTLFRSIEGQCLFPHGSVVCIGAFDGVHLGHQALIQHTLQRANILQCPAVVVSFEPQPREFFARSAPPARITLMRNKVQAIRHLGVNHIGLLRFNAQLAAMSAEDFVQQLLVQRLNIKELWIGPEFRFGHQRRGDLSLLKTLGNHYGFSANEIPVIEQQQKRISSTEIRHHLQQADFAAVKSLLGRAYSITGRVIRGQQLGRTLGFPTANIAFPKTPPLSGIFATWVHGVTENPIPSVSSFGTRPTVDGIEPLLETHLFDFNGNLYGRSIEVEFVAKLRDEQKFPDLEQLTVQMHHDADTARHLLSTYFLQRASA